MKIFLKKGSKYGIPFVNSLGEEVRIHKNAKISDMIRAGVYPRLTRKKQSTHENEFISKKE